MCANMQEFQTISEKIFELEQKKAKKKREMDALEKESKQLKSETSSYMKKRQKNIFTVAGIEVLFAAYVRPTFDKDAFRAGEDDGLAIYNKYLKIFLWNGLQSNRIKALRLKNLMKKRQTAQSKKIPLYIQHTQMMKTTLYLTQLGRFQN